MKEKKCSVNLHVESSGEKINIFLPKKKYVDKDKQQFFIFIHSMKQRALILPVKFPRSLTRWEWVIKEDHNKI